jgi:hypothetical protein
MRCQLAWFLIRLQQLYLHLTLSLLRLQVRYQRDQLHRQQTWYRFKRRRLYCRQAQLQELDNLRKLRQLLRS